MTAIERIEAILALLRALEEIKEGRIVVAIKLLRPLTGLSGSELAKAIALARGEEPQGEASAEVAEVGAMLKKFL